MRRTITLLCLALCLLSLVRERAAAGGAEFPSGGGRGIGRGSANFARADDPMVMLRNPALLADLWSDMAMAGANVLLAGSCFQATGDFGYQAGMLDVADFGDGPVFVNPTRGSTDLNGQELPRIQDEPLPEVCYQGPVPVLPHVGLTMKLMPDLGVGIGFFPPDNAALSQWGDRDGTVDTPNGRRPSPTRWFRSHLNTSYFSALGAVGYRMTDWLRVGLGFQWAALAYSTTTWSRSTVTLSLNDDNRTKVFGRDLFVPGVIASAQITPFDALDIAIGFKWSDRVESRAKLDVTTGVFGTGEVFEYRNAAGEMQRIGSAIPNTTDNIIGRVSAPPIWVPQASLGIRFADRLSPRVTRDKWNSAHAAAGRSVQDSMTTERWDIEADAIVYFNSATDYRKFSTPAAFVALNRVNGEGVSAASQVRVGACPAGKMQGEVCTAEYEVPANLYGKNQLSLRLGGDYNLFPGVFSVRAGVSYETDGQDPRNVDITNYMLGRTGIHVGATLRIADKTDISVGFAHFIQKNVRLLFNTMAVPPDWTMDPGRYHVVQGENDGTAGFAISDSADPGDGPNFANAGEFNYNLSVVTFSIAQHF